MNKKRPCGECLRIMKEELDIAYQQGCKSAKTKTGIDLQRFRKWIKSNWGTKCKDHAFGCVLCSVWRVYNDLKDLIDTSEGYDKESKTKKKGR